MPPSLYFVDQKSETWRKQTYRGHLVREKQNGPELAPFSTPGCLAPGIHHGNHHYSIVMVTLPILSPT